MLASRGQLMTWHKTSGLQRLPYEIMAYIVQDLTIDDIFNLSLCSHHFQYVVREESLCKAIITAKASYTLEAEEARLSGCFSRALRRLAKRRLALSQASPYVVGIVGLADNYEYFRGKLCYIIEARPRRWLRILDLHGPTSHELVIDIPTLVREAVPRSAKSRKYKFRILYHANGITSCLFSFALPNTENWLLIFKADEQRILEKIRLESTAKIFVRNNEDYLYFGTHSETGADGLRKWVLQGFSIRDRTWFPRKIHLSNLVGYDMASTVCFEIIDEYFYGLSNQTAFEVEEIDWTSYYYCFRFRLNTPDPTKTEIMEKDSSWRRQHAEGPIDDRWGFLKLEKDEASGKINIIEARKEWLAGQSGSLRTYYITELVFQQNSELGVSSRLSTPHDARTDAQSPGLIGYIDRPKERTPQGRLPQNVHPGDDSSVTSIFTRSMIHLRSYQRCCETFLDLIDDASDATLNRQSLCLRTGYRRPRPITISRSNSALHNGLTLNEQIAQQYQPNQIYRWPPRKKQWNSDQLLDDVYQILNPPGYLGSIIASSDERSVVYSTGTDSNGLKALVYLSFDPAAKLTGMIYGGRVLGERDMANSQREAEGAGFCSEPGANGTLKHSHDVIPGTKGKETAMGHVSHGPSAPYVVTSTSTDVPSMHTLPPPPEGDTPWAWFEKPMYQDLPSKRFGFALEVGK
ncbi:hypothetical protein F4779DRAFT_47366 [Xylariaceae sp. FL0662B]|nr:hypothetical protein F4779DRAFT_47366 [Xylariaceae sp. FL0662B]